MLPDEQEVVQITPLPESLVITHNTSHGVYTCPTDGCSFSTPSPSMLGLHKAQVHNIKSSPKKGLAYQYFCPHYGCYYNPESGRFFKTLDILRTHYMKVHMEKKFKCSKCDKAFGLERDSLRHEKECGQMFVCPDCGKSYNNKGGLRMHCIAKGHKKPPELSSKPRTPAVKPSADKKQQKRTKEQGFIPILPKFSSQDTISLIDPAQRQATTVPHPPSTATVLNQHKSFVTVMIQTDKTNSSNIADNLVSSQCQTDFQIHHPPPVSIIHTPLSGKHKKPRCDSVTQTMKPFPSQPKAKRHAPTQTQLSILERAMKSSKIPITKTSKATQKSMTSSRKRKNIDKGDSSTKKNKPRSKLTVATLTDPQNTVSQNIGSQTMFPVLYQNQQTSMEVNMSAMSTQTSSVEYSYYQSQGHEYLNAQNVSYLSQGTSPDPMASRYNDSITQTLNSLLPPVTTCQLDSSETQTTCLTQSSSSTTQTQESLALDSSTQTLDFNLDDSASFLEDLFPESSGVNVNTQTFGCFSSDMMTQTLEQLASDESHDISTNTFGTGNIFVTNDTTTQTFDEMVDSITQTLDANISDCTTQTSLRTDIMTQTFDHLGIDIMTQTLATTTDSGIDYDGQSLGSQSQTFDNISQTDYSIFYENDAATQCATVGNSCNTTTQTQTDIPNSDHAFSKDTQSFADILNLITENSTSTDAVNKETKNSEDVAIQATPSIPTSMMWGQTSNSLLLESQVQTTQTSASGVREMALQTESVDLWDVPTQTPMGLLSRADGNDNLNLNRERSEFENAIIQSSLPLPINPVTDSMTQTLSLPDDAMTLEALLSDMATQTFDEDDFTFDALLQSSDHLPSCGFGTQTSHSLPDTACERLVASCEAEKETNSIESSLPRESVWEIGTQTLEDVREMALQTDSEGLWDISIQTTEADLLGCGNHAFTDETLETATQTAIGVDFHGGTEFQHLGNDFWETGTQTGGDNAWEMATQTGGDNAWEMATQTGGDNAWEMATQTGGDNAWEMATQTGGDNVGGMGTQTGGDSLWEMGTQTGGDNAGGMGTQTEGDNAWEMATQTGGIDIWEMGTQTGGDNAGGMGTQTGGDNAWEMGIQTGGMGTQTGGDNAWEMATQTGGIDIWEMGTQTGGDNAGGMGTQTGGDNAWEMATQTGGIDIWEMGTQTGGDSLWEMGTQTGGDSLWEMGTQTMEGLLTDTMTQTGDDLIDFLLISDTC